MSRRVNEVDEELLVVADVEEGDGAAFHRDPSLLIIHNCINVNKYYSIKRRQSEDQLNEIVGPKIFTQNNERD